MPDHDPEVVAVLAEALQNKATWADPWPMAVEQVLRHLTAAGYAVVKLPEETVYGCKVEGHPNNHTHSHRVAVEHGAKLVGAWPYDKRETYAIEATPPTKVAHLLVKDPEVDKELRQFSEFVERRKREDTP